MCLNFIQGLISSCQQIQVGLDVEVNTRNNIKHRLRLQNSVFALLEYKRERERDTEKEWWHIIKRKRYELFE